MTAADGRGATAAEGVAIVTSGTAGLMTTMMLALPVPVSPVELGNRFWLAVLIEAVASAAFTFAIVHMVANQPETEQPAVWLWLALAVFGVLGMLIAPSVFDWPNRYHPTDGRSQPGTVLAAFLAGLFGGAAIFVMGIALALIRLRVIRRLG